MYNCNIRLMVSRRVVRVPRVFRRDPVLDEEEGTTCLLNALQPIFDTT